MTIIKILGYIILGYITIFGITLAVTNAINYIREEKIKREQLEVKTKYRPQNMQKKKKLKNKKWNPILGVYEDE